MPVLPKTSNHRLQHNNAWNVISSFIFPFFDIIHLEVTPPTRLLKKSQVVGSCFGIFLKGKKKLVRLASGLFISFIDVLLNKKSRFKQKY
jgi:hypothetical protein